MDAIAGQRLGLDTKETVALPVYTQDQLAEMGRATRSGRAKPNPADVFWPPPNRSQRRTTRRRQARSHPRGIRRGADARLRG